MALVTTRIAESIDVERMRRSRVVVIGVGGAANLVASLVRCGLGAVTLIDLDTVSELNLVRQEFDRLDVGKPKVDALCYRLKQITIDLDVNPLAVDVTTLGDSECDRLLGSADLILATTDAFAAQSWANRAALKYRIPAVWPGVYERGLGGEIVFWRPGLPCYRCLMANRYRAQEQARIEGRKADPISDGTTVFETGLIDAIAGQLVIGLLTDGAENRYGRLVEKLGDRNFLHVKLDSEYRLNGRDVIREQLGVPEHNDRYFAWSVAARRDPDGGDPPCADCLAFGHAARNFQATNTRSLSVHPPPQPRT